MAKARATEAAIRPALPEGTAAALVDRLQGTDAFSRSVLDSIVANICVVDADGRIFMVNRGWRDFALGNAGPLARVCEGANYLEACDAAAADPESGVREPATAVADVIRGRGEVCAVEYGCHSPSEPRWFRVEATRFTVFGAQYTAIVHSNITARRESELATHLSEARFRSLADLSSDYYWETDAKHRLTRRHWNDRQQARPAVALEAIVGKKRSEGANVSPGVEGWKAHEALLEQRLSFRDFAFSRLADDGTVRYLSVSGEPMFDDEGTFQGYRGVGTDITRRKHDETLLALEHAVTRALAEAQDVDAGLKSLLRAVCELQNWDYGRYWKLDETAGVLRFGEAWSVPDPVIVRHLEQTRGITFRPGSGLVGIVLATGKPVLEPDLSANPLVLQDMFAHASGLRGACTFPVIFEGKTIGVLAFVGREVRRADSQQLDAMAAIGSQAGQFLKRKRAEVEIRENEARFRSLTELSSDWYWEQDDECRFVDFSGGIGKWGNDRNDLIGKRRWEIPGVVPVSGSWEEHQAVLAARRPFRDFQYSRVRGDGTPHYVSASGHPVFDEAGRFTGYRGVATDITAHKREDGLRELAHSTARLLALGDESGTTLESVMGEVCRSEGFDCGRYFEVDEEKAVLRFAGGWGGPGDAIRSFLDQSRDIRFRCGEGLAGVVWQSGEPLWVEDVTRDSRTINGGLATTASVHSAFVVPVFSEGRTVGVLSFSSQRMRSPDKGLLKTAQAIGSQLGQYLGRKRGEEVLLRFRAALNASGDTIALIDRASLRYIDANQTFCDLVGYTREEILTKTPMDLFSATREDLERDYDALIADSSGPARSLLGDYRRKDGTRVAVETRRRALRTKDGWIIVANARDITVRIAQEQALRNSNQRLELQARRQERIARFGQFALKRRSSDELAAEAVTELGDLADVVALFERTGEEVLTLRIAHGELAAESAGQSAPLSPDSAAFRVLESGRSVPVSGDYLAATPVSWPWSAWMRQMAGGAFVPVTHNGHAHGMLGIFSRKPGAIGEEEVRFAESIGNALSTALQREKAEHRLVFLAQFDSLTGLPNRNLLEDRLKQTIAQAQRKQRSAGVLFVDLDRFKLINDTLGHQAGDMMIREVGSRLEKCVRPDDTVGRLSGDEFAVVLADLAHAEDAGLVAQKILDDLARPFDLGGSETFVTASIGISICPGDSEDADTLLRNADMAMYKAKKTTRNAYRYFTARMNERTLAKLQINTDLRRAVERREFALHYQPKVDLNTGALTGMEALLRWNHPQRGLVSPAEFIPALEDSGLIMSVGEWVMDEACAQQQRWQSAGLRAVPVSINLSAKQFRRGDLDQVIQRSLAAAGLPAALLELEITESSLADDPDDAVRVLQNLRAAGLNISIDDFGTGYSSLSYLTRLPLSALKIDRSFVRDAAERPEAASIVRAIIDMAHNLKFTVVAEGVETDWQAQFLRLYKCDQAQGYLYGRPVAPAEIEGRLTRTVPG